MIGVDNAGAFSVTALKEENANKSLGVILTVRGKGEMIDKKALDNWILSTPEEAYPNLEVPEEWYLDGCISLKCSNLASCEETSCLKLDEWIKNRLSGETTK